MYRIPTYYSRLRALFVARFFPSFPSAASFFLSAVTVSEKMKASGVLKEYRVIGRKLPTPEEPETPLYRMRIFAPDPVVAKSRYTKEGSDVEVVNVYYTSWWNPPHLNLSNSIIILIVNERCH